MTKGKLKAINDSVDNLIKLEREVEENREASESFMSEIWNDAEEKEKLYYGGLSDVISTKVAKSSIFDPRLQTIVFERAARNTARDHIGYSRPVSDDDAGKSLLMDLQLDFDYQHAKSQYSMPIKMRMAAVNSGIYGEQFALTPWRVDSRRNCIGPDLELIPIYNAYPQPGVTLNDADWFGVRSVVTLEWLKAQDKSVWKNIDKIVAEYEGDGGDSLADNDKNKTSWMERELHPNRTGTKRFPMIVLYTEYRLDKWITLVLRNPKIKSSRTRVVRVVESPLDGLLPIVSRTSLPVMGRAVGYGDVERLATLQKGLNSLDNLHLDWIKFAVHPPIQINPNAEGLVRSSIVNAPAARWFTGRPNIDIQPTQVNPIPGRLFADTYGFFVGAMNTAAGTTSTNEGDSVTSTLGKTPAAIEYQNQRQNARDAWDQKMHEDFIREIYLRWQQYEVRLREKSTTIRLFGNELEKIGKTFPDITYAYDNKHGKAVIKPGVYKNEKGEPIAYDYDVEVGSTVNHDQAKDGEAGQALLELVVKNPQFVQEMEQRWGKTVNKAKLLEKAFSSAGIKDWDEIVVESAGSPQTPQEATGMEGEPVAMQPEMQAEMQPNQQYDYGDPDVAAIAQKIFQQ